MGYNNTIRELTNDELKRLQSCLLHMLKDFIFVCEKYHLKYTLGGGSVLGAVRHQGFIPWDDDLDINMPRDDYERFKEVFPQELAEEYDLQVPNSEYGTLTLFMKMMKKGTVYQQQFTYDEKDKPYIWIDIFPFDNTPDNRLICSIKGFFCQVFAFTFVSRYIYEHSNRATAEYYQKNGLKNKLKYKGRLLLAKLIPVHYAYLYDFFDKFVRNSGPSEKLTCATGRKHYLGEIVDKDYFKKAEKGKFNGIDVLLPYHCKDYLSNLYGDYMTIPPIEKREHHYTTRFHIPENLDFRIKDVTDQYMETISEEDFIKEYGSCMFNEETYELCAINARYYIAGNKLNELIELYNTGRSYLIDAVNSDEWYYKVGIEDAVSILWHRHTSFLVAALLLSHCMDYFLQILWAFVDPKQYIENKDLASYHEHLREGTYGRLAHVAKLLKGRSNYKIWEDTLEQYDNCQVMRQKIVNALKHHGYVHCNDLERDNVLAVFWKIKADGKSVNIKDFESRISLREEKKIIMDAFVGFRPLIEEYMQFLQPANFFEVKDTGSICPLKMKDFPDWNLEV